MKHYEAPVMELTALELADILTLSVSDWKDPVLEQEFGDQN